MCMLNLRHLNLNLLRITRSFIMGKDNMDWDLEISIYWPHAKFCIGWEIILADKKYNYDTYKLHLGILTITLNINN